MLKRVKILLRISLISMMQFMISSKIAKLAKIPWHKFKIEMMSVTYGMLQVISQKHTSFGMIL